MGKRNIKRITGYVIILLFTVTLWGCQGVKKAFYINNDSSLERQVRVNTRSAKLYRNLKTAAISSVTLLNKQLISRYFPAYRNGERFSDDLKNKTKQIDEFTGKTLFFVRFYSPQKGFQNLDKKSQWRISFAVNGKRLYADSIEKVKNVDWEYLLKRDAWSNGYIVSFDTATKAGTVEISSILGELKFNFLHVS